MNTNYKSLILTVSLFFALSTSISAVPGDLDPTFSGDGKLIDGTLVHSGENANTVAIQADGKIVVAAIDSSTKGSATEVTHTNYSFLPLGGVTGGAVSAIAISGSNVYVGGTFNAAGDISANYIAKWDGTTWSTLGSGMNGFVNTLAVAENGDLYAGGSFTTAGGVSANRVARWDGASWSALGSGINGSVWALEVSGTDVYAGGAFNLAGGVSANHIARWNGSGWSPLGSGMNDRVNAMALSENGDLYVGGRFTTAGGVSASKIAKWNGSGWSALGSGLTSGIQSQVNTIAVSGSTVYAGGFFTFAGGLPANNIAMWNGSSWSPLGSGIVGAVNALAISESGTVYVGGDFISAGEISANNMASWNGSSWSTLGSGLNSSGGNWVLALAISGNGNVYAGGYFTTAGNRQANNIAVWNGTGWAALKPCTAATMAVLNNNDSGAGSLRDAIAGVCPGGTISFDPGVFTAPQTITLTSGELVIDTDMTIQGPGASLLSISGNDTSRVIYVDGASAALEGMTIRDGFAGDGAGITNHGTLSLSNSTISGNSAVEYAGGIRNIGSLTLTNSSVTGNTAVGADGAFGNNGTMTVTNSIISGNRAGGGGGIWNGGTLTITRSTISGNTADGGGGSYYDLNGGGIYNQGGTLIINNCTMSGNAATNGGGVYNTYGWDDNGGTVYLTNITMSGNNGGGIFSDGSSETLTNNIVAGNTGGDISGAIETASHNLIDDAASAGGMQNGVNGNIVGVDPLLGPLQNNGGSTMTHALLASSPAINAGNNCVLTENGCGYSHPALPTDQRGFPRFGTVDIGAYDFSEPTPVTPTPTANPIDYSNFFISQQYRDFLGREAEPDGLQFYLNMLAGCGPTDTECIRYTRGALSANFFRSPEFQRKGNFVMYLYMVSIGQRPVTAAELATKNDPTLNDRPHFAEFSADLASISTANDDPVLTEQKKNELTEAWLLRTQLQQLYPASMSHAAFVQKLIETSGVTPASQNWVAELNAGTKTRARVLREFAESPEVSAKFYQQSFVTMEYFGYLRRDPEDCHNPANWTGGDPNQCGFIFHNSRFNTPGANSDLIENIIVRGFIESPEYRRRF